MQPRIRTTGERNCRAPHPVLAGPPVDYGLAITIIVSAALAACLARPGRGTGARAVNESFPGSIATAGRRTASARSSGRESCWPPPGDCVRDRTTRGFDACWQLDATGTPPVPLPCVEPPPSRSHSDLDHPHFAERPCACDCVTSDLTSALPVGAHEMPVVVPSFGQRRSAKSRPLAVRRYGRFWHCWLRPETTHDGSSESRRTAYVPIGEAQVWPNVVVRGGRVRR